MRVYDASTRISAEFGGIRDLSRHLSLNLNCKLFCELKCLFMYLAKAVIAAGGQDVRPVVDERDCVHVVIVRVDSEKGLACHH